MQKKNKIPGYKFILFSLMAVFILFAASRYVSSEYGQGRLYTTQDSFILDLDNPQFNYTNTYLNNTDGFHTSKTLTYDSSGDKTVFISVPKDSTVNSLEFNLTGSIKPLENHVGGTTAVNNNDVSLSQLIKISSVSIGDVPTSGGAEISISAEMTTSDPNTMYLADSSGTVLWAGKASGSPYPIRDTVIADFAGDSSNDVLFCGDSIGIRVYGTTYSNLLWSCPDCGIVYSIDVGELTAATGNELVYGDDSGNITILNRTGNTDGPICTYNDLSGADISAIKIADIDDDGNNDIIAGTSNGKVYFIDSSCNKIAEYSADGYIINAIDAYDYTTDTGMEIVVGAEKLDETGLYLMLNSTLDQLWSLPTAGKVLSIVSGEFDSSRSGSEILGGTADHFVQLLDKNGQIYWNYETDREVSALALGDIQSNTGSNVNDLVVGTMGGESNLRILNYDSFPTNITLDIGVDSSVEWTYSEGDGRLRNSTIAASQTLIDAINDYIQNTCTSNNECSVPIEVHSEVNGILEVKYEMNYTYDASGDISYSETDYWTKTSEINVNESVVNRANNITFSDPALTMTVRYVSMNPVATSCGFMDDGSDISIEVTTIGGNKYCRISDYESNPGYIEYKFLWDNTMASGIPITMTSSASYMTETANNFLWRKNLTISSQNTITSQTFSNIIANSTINDSDTAVRGEEFLNVSWNGVICNIIPSGSDNQCNTTTPSYTNMVCNGATFRVCKKDLDSNGIIDFVKWKQPYLGAIDSTTYTIGGSSNILPELENMNVTPSSDYWGRYFNYSVYVNSTDSDFINVSLYTYSGLSGTWEYRETKNTVGSGLLWFSVNLSKSMSGASNKYRFLYQDFTSDTYTQIHNAAYASETNGPSVSRHNITVEHIFGNDTYAVRGSTPSIFTVRVNDTTDDVYIGESGVICTFNVTRDGTTFAPGFAVLANSSGYCTYSFTPDMTYGIGTQKWTVTVDPRYYIASEQTNWTLTVKGGLNISLVTPENDGIIPRNANTSATARLINQYGLPINSTTINVNNYNCSWYLDGNIINTTSINSSGYCTTVFEPGCSYATLGDYVFDVRLNYTEDPDNYTINANTSAVTLSLFDNISLSIDDPVDSSSHFRGSLLPLEVTLLDSCATHDTNTRNITWYMGNDDILVTINETQGLTMGNTIISITASDLYGANNPLSNWLVNSTKVVCNGTIIPNMVTNPESNHLSSTSSIIFMLNISEYENITCMLTSNESQVSGNYTMSYIPNGGFESGTMSGWSGDAEVVYDATAPKGNYSIKLESYDEITPQTVTRTFDPLTTDAVKLWYKHDGVYTPGSSFINVTIGNQTFHLNLTYSSGAFVETSWRTAILTGENITGQSNITIGLYIYDGNTGGFYLDHICAANTTTGNCISEDSGADLSKIVTTRSEIEATTSKITSWLVPFEKRVGLHTVSAIVQGPNYYPSSDYSEVYLYGYSSITDFGFESTACDGYYCFKGANITLLCSVIDANTTLPLSNASVYFYANGTLMDNQPTYTDESGQASYEWDSMAATAGNYNISCNISDSSKPYYNITVPFENSTIISLFSESTIGNMSFISGIDYLESINVTIYNITKISERLQSIDIFIDNIGDTIMSSPRVIGYNNTGITVLGGEYSAIPYLSNYSTSISVIVSRFAEAGITPVYVSLEWLNNASAFYNQTITLNITNTTYLEIVNKTSIDYLIPYGSTKLVGNFTIESYGNTPLYDINISIGDLDYSEIENWSIGFSNNSFGIEKYGNETIFVTVTVPENSSLMGNNYLAYITANATGSRCIYQSDNCSDRILLNLTITDQDWHVSPSYELSKTVGLGGRYPQGSYDDMINITNLRNETLSINISMVNSTPLRFVELWFINGSVETELTSENQTFYVLPYDYANINITYDISNASNSDVNTTYFNISYYNSNVDIVPDELTSELSFSISSLNVEIMDPSIYYPREDTLAGDLLNFTLNITRNMLVLSDEENTTIYINVTDQECPITGISFDNYDYVWYVNCTAPLIPGNPQNTTVDIAIFYEMDNINLTYSTSYDGIITYRDVTSPSINTIKLNDVVLSPYTEANILSDDSLDPILIVINSTDNVGVTDVWLEVTDPSNNRTSYSLSRNITDSSLWNTTYHPLGQSGDYKIEIHSTDGLENHTTNYTAWFDVYNGLTFTDSMTDANGNSVSAQIDFYKSGTDWIFHSVDTDSNGYYGQQIHKRLYDVKVSVFGQEVIFNEFNSTSSAINKSGDPDTTTLSGAFQFHLIPNSSASTNGSNIVLPTTAENLLMAMVIDTPSMQYTNATVIMHYGDYLRDEWITAGGTEGNLRIYYCSDWDLTLFICNSGAFTEFDTSIEPNVLSDTINFTTTHNSAYALASWCHGECHVTSGDSDDDGGSGGTSSSGGGSSGSTVSEPECGNSICESGETEENCPADCSYHVCGNDICEPTENIYNCPSDCKDEPFTYETDFNFMNIELEKGTNATYELTVKNSQDTDAAFNLSISGDIVQFINLSDSQFYLSTNSTRKVKIMVSAPANMTSGSYSGSINILSGSYLKKVPVKITVSENSDLLGSISSMEVKVITKKVVPSEALKFNVMLYVPDMKKDLEVKLKYVIKNAQTEEIMKIVEKTYAIHESTNFRESIDLSDIKGLENGEYYVEVTGDYGKTITATDTFEVVQSFFATTRGRMLIGSVLFILFAYLMYIGYNKYKIWKQSRARYVFPMDYSKLPDAVNPFVVGKIAETNRPANYNPNDLTTHALVTGSTGAGKSVAASIFIEEALKQKIPVIVFDPTAQWTGFVRPCKDNNLLKFYPDFGMNPEDARPFPGMIYEVTDPNVKIDIKKYMNPGEITVFTLNRLKPGEYDVAVEKIIDTIFQITWEESPDLKMIVVFDEVHRLLEKYGGKGGYIALEKACREFRKWGIGMLMSSQVYSDFKEAIQGNILTEIQLNTKSLSDISKIKEKYGAVYSEKISRQGIGVGMIQNPRYNDGKPWFIHFRPTLHSPHKITDEELKQYNDYAEKLAKIEKSIEKLKAKGVNVMDFELEFKLASSKLKQGHFKMAEIYIQSLLNHKSLSDA